MSAAGILYDMNVTPWLSLARLIFIPVISITYVGVSASSAVVSLEFTPFPSLSKKNFGVNVFSRLASVLTLSISR